MSVICSAYWVMAGLSVFALSISPSFVWVVNSSTTQGHAGIGGVSKVLDCPDDGRNNLCCKPDSLRSLQVTQTESR